MCVFYSKYNITKHSQDPIELFIAPVVSALGGTANKKPYRGLLSGSREYPVYLISSKDFRISTPHESRSSPLSVVYFVNTPGGQILLTTLLSLDSIPQSSYEPSIHEVCGVLGFRRLAVYGRNSRSVFFGANQRPTTTSLPVF